MKTGLLTVRRSIVPVRGVPTVLTPKTKAGERAFTLPEPAMDALRGQWAMQAKDKLAAGERWLGEGWVFADSGGTMLDPGYAARRFRHIRDQAKVQPLRFHCLRHSAVSVQMAAGVRPEIIAKRIGHKRVSLTIDLYGHLLPEADQDAADAVNEFARRRATKG